MKRILVVGAMLGFALLGSGCQRIETGETGLRVGFDKQVQQGELRAGSFNQVVVGDVLIFPFKQIGITEQNLTPQTADHVNLKDMDVQVLYSINPSAAYDLYTTRSHALNATAADGGILLMYSYMQSVIGNAAQDAVSKFKALDVPTHRTDIQTQIKKNLEAILEAEDLKTSITVDQVIVNSAIPPDEIVASATKVITAQNEYNAKEVQLNTARLEAQRQDLLAKPSNIAYMNAQASLNISEGVKEGKVQAILLPHNMTMFGGLGK